VDGRLLNVSIEQMHYIFHDSVVGFQKTANFATQMNRSTGLPVTDGYRAGIARANPLKHSFANTISVIGQGLTQNESQMES
jgi:hypothetical protein